MTFRAAPGSQMACAAAVAMATTPEKAAVAERYPRKTLVARHLLADLRNLRKRFVKFHGHLPRGR